MRQEGHRRHPAPARRLVLLIIVATLPLFVMVFLNDAISTLFANPILVSCALLATGFVLYFSDRMAKGHKTAKNAPWRTPSSWAAGRLWR